MTYIEFFDRISSENISACLTYVPDRVIYIGDNARIMKKYISCYERVFKERGYNIDFSFKTVSKSNFDNAIQVLTEIVQEYDDCVFDITGGEEILNLALGFVCASHSDKNIQIHRFNLRNNTVHDCDNDGVTIYKQTPTLTVEENVRIYGGDVIYGDVFGDNTYKWELNEDFVCDINRMWSVCKANVRYWNTVIGIIEAIETVGQSDVENALTTSAEKGVLDEYLARHRIRCSLHNGIIKSLVRYGLIKLHEDSDGGTVRVSYKNEQIKRCLTKAGQALEMKIFLTAKNARDTDGEYVYDDAVNGVVIDWDGELHDEETEHEYDTENEIDIMLMHDIVPVFISCKNGIVTADELYKLNTVAQRFGGQYAKKVLVATSVSSLGMAGEYLRQRARDMNIRILEDVQSLDDAELERKLRSLWCN